MKSKCSAALFTVLVSLTAVIAKATGAAWETIPSPNKSNWNYFSAVAATSSFDVWAVGSAYSSTLGHSTLIEHWNGTTWSIVASPSPGTPSACGAQSYAGNYLYGVAAVSANDAWAVGEICPNGFGRTLIEHWNGSKWTVVPSPNESGQTTNTLVAVSASSANDAWAVGNYLLNDQYSWKTLVEHWNGTRWSIVPTPNAARGQKSFLNAVTAISDDNVWAVGTPKTPKPRHMIFL